jgi:PLP dependent protein
MPYRDQPCKGIDNTEEARRRVGEVRERIAAAASRSGRNQDDVTLVAVSKGRSVPEIVAVREAGVADFGENYAQEAEEKARALTGAGCRWHFIGHLQRNKARRVLGFSDWVHCLDSAPLAQDVDRHAGALGRRTPCLIEVNVGGEASKQGVAPEGLPALYESASALPNVELRGLMAMAPWPPDEATARPAFVRLRQLAEQLRERGFDARDLSMGMTADYEVAVEEGATLVRVGTAIFGAARQN